MGDEGSPNTRGSKQRTVLLAIAPATDLIDARRPLASPISPGLHTRPAMTIVMVSTAPIHIPPTRVNYSTWIALALQGDSANPPRVSSALTLTAMGKPELVGFAAPRPPMKAVNPMQQPLSCQWTRKCGRKSTPPSTCPQVYPMPTVHCQSRRVSAHDDSKPTHDLRKPYRQPTDFRRICRVYG